jgi:hypothetical protein
MLFLLVVSVLAVASKIQPARAQILPFVISGIAELNGVLQSGVNISITDNTPPRLATGTWVTDSAGEYAASLSDPVQFPSGYDIGDSITISCSFCSQTITVPYGAGSTVGGITVNLISINVSIGISISPSSVFMDVGQSELFTSNVSGGTGPYSYQWYLNGVPVSGATNATWTFTPTSIEFYTVYLNVTDSVGVIAISNTATVTVGTQDVAVTDVASSKTVVGQSFSANISVTAANQGDFTETFNLTTYANATITGSENVTLPSGNSATVTFTLNTTSFGCGNYTISAYAWPIPGETNTADNNLTGGVVTVTIPGDINGDGTVNILDAIQLSNAFLATPGSSNWNPNADINGDGIVNILDAIILANHFLQHFP